MTLGNTTIQHPCFRTCSGKDGICTDRLFCAMKMQKACPVTWFHQPFDKGYFLQYGFRWSLLFFKVLPNYYWCVAKKISQHGYIRDGVSERYWSV